MGAYNFGILLEQCGDVEGAEAAYRRADEHGLAAGAYNFGVLLEERGDVEGAIAAYRRAIQSGDSRTGGSSERSAREIDRLTPPKWSRLGTDGGAIGCTSA